MFQIDYLCPLLKCIWTSENNIAWATERMVCLWVTHWGLRMRGYFGQSSLSSFQLCIHVCMCLSFSFFWLRLWGGQSLILRRSSIKTPSLRPLPLFSLPPSERAPVQPDYFPHLASCTSSCMRAIRPALFFCHLSNMCWQIATHANTDANTHTLALPLFPTFWTWAQAQPVSSMKAQNLCWMTEWEAVDRKMLFWDLTMCTHHR